MFNSSYTIVLVALESLKQMVSCVGAKEREKKKEFIIQLQSGPRESHGGGMSLESSQGTDTTAH